MDAGYNLSYSENVECTSTVGTESPETSSCEIAALKAMQYGIGGAIVGGVAGVIVGAVIGAPLLLTAGVYAASTAASAAFDSMTESLGQAYEWKPSNVLLIKIAINVIIGTAFIVATVSLGIFGPIGAGIVGGCIALQLAYGITETIELKIAEQKHRLNSKAF